MTAIDIAPETEATTVDRSKVNVAADSEANRTENFASKPMTGDEYIESLRDDREIWLNGERVKDVTTHEAFRNPIRMTARLYDAMHDPATKDKVTAPTDTGNGGVTMPFFRAPKSADDLRADRDAIATWARMTYGWMGRSPDYKASFLGTLHANSELYAPFQANAERWYKESQEKVLYWNHAIINPPVDRQLPPDEVGPRSSRPARRSPTTTSSPTTACRSRRSSSPSSAPSRWMPRASSSSAARRTPSRPP